MKIKRERSEYYKRRMAKLFADAPESKYVRNRNRTVRFCLLEKYKWAEAIPKEEMTAFIHETIYLDRILRLATEKIEKSTKKILSDQFIEQELQ